MESLAYYNGEVTSIEDARIPALDRSVYFGDGVYDTTCAHEHTPFAMREHTARLFRSMAKLEINPPMDEPDLRRLIFNLCTKVDAGDLFVYWQVSRGTGIRSHVFPDGPANLLVMIWPLKADTSVGGAKLITEEDVRFLTCDAKTTNLIPNVLASERAKRAGCQEAVFHRGDIVTECAHSNVHILKDGRLKTHPADNLILAGITRAHIIRICQEEGIPVDEEPFTVAELMDADEVIISSCSKLGICVSEIDSKPVGGRDSQNSSLIHSRLVEEFFAETED